jgi:hypothetical protein
LSLYRLIPSIWYKVAMKISFIRFQTIMDLQIVLLFRTGLRFFFILPGIFLSNFLVIFSDSLLIFLIVISVSALYIRSMALQIVLPILLN